MPLELTIQEGGGPARRQVLAKDVVFLGRREDNDVVLPYSFVSARHGRLFRREGALYVEDMGSTNGTLVNEQPLTPLVARALGPDDLVKVGEIVLQARWTEGGGADDAEALTYHELPRPAALATTRGASAPPPPPTPAAPALPVPFVGSAPPAPSPEEPAAFSGLTTTAHLGQSSLSDALATGRPQARADEAERDPYRLWEIFIKTVGLVAILGGLVLLVFALVA
jgi:predicted component of type VI protein secretion system